MPDDDASWETPRGMESFVALPDGTFTIKTPMSDQQARAAVATRPLESASAKLNEPPAKRPEASTKRKPSMAEIKAAGRAKVKAQQKARAAELDAQQCAEALWEDAFDMIFDSAADPTARSSDFLIEGRTVLVLVPGFASWLSLTRAHVDRWKQAAILANPAKHAGASDRDSNSCDDAVSLVFKWPCGEVAWANEDAQVEAAAAWQDAHEATFAAARSLTLLLQKLKERNCSLVVAAHSLGCRVALQALANDIAAPRVDGLHLLGAAVDSYCLTGLNPFPDPAAERASADLNGYACDFAGQGAPTQAPAEFPLERLMGKCTSLSLAHSSKDPALTTLWQLAEYARCGRVAPAALGATGPVQRELEAANSRGEWSGRVGLLDVTAELGASHDPTEYLLAEAVRVSVRDVLFPKK